MGLSSRRHTLPRQKEQRERSAVLQQPDLLDRELGILAFNERVLALAEDTEIPLLERLRFLTIVSSNLDEFFEIRVAEIQEKVKLDGAGAPAARAALAGITERTSRLISRQYALLNERVLPALRESGVTFLMSEHWTPQQRAWAEDYFASEVEPILTPIALDPAHPFPRILNKSLNFVVELAGDDAFGRRADVAIVQAPRVLPRVVEVPDEICDCEHGFMLLSSIMQGCVQRLFPGMTVKAVHQFRLTRNSDLFVDEEEITNLRLALQGELPQRHYGDAVRLEVSAAAAERVVSVLLREFDLGPANLYRVPGPVNMVRLAQVIDLVDMPELKFAPFTPGLPPALRAAATPDDLFGAIRAGDVLLHHPYESFAPVAEFLRSAVSDPAVVAIKQTIYRTGADSALMEGLIAAARTGKEVTVVVELMARFDEEANINWAAQLEQAGAHVVYGVVGHKTHAKMALVLRREGGKLRRYVHLGTGNYHPRTARAYEDFGLFTCHDGLCDDVQEVFRRLTGLGSAGPLKLLWQSPFTMYDGVVASIRREAEHARAGRKARVIAKVNALLEPGVIHELYEASRAGVRVDLIVRGVCALRPGVPGLSDNIRVRSLIGRFLEHSRVFYFLNDGAEDVWLASADWMDRNFFRRVETAFPVLDRRLKRRVIQESLVEPLRDNEGAWVMDEDGRYSKRRGRGKSRRNAQQRLLEKLAARSPD